MQYFSGAGLSLDLREVNRAVEAAFADHGMGLVQMPPKVYITLPGGDFRTMPAYLPSAKIAGVKIVNVHPDNPKKGLPTVMALTVILDIATGRPLALLNATRLTDIRTGAAGAVAARYLSRKKTITLGVAGTGRQAGAQVRATAEELEIEQILIWSRTTRHAEKFRTDMKQYDCRVVSLEQACNADVIVTTTPSRSPIIRSEWVHAGTHINAIGADAPGKQELDPALLLRAQVFVDDMAQAVHSGEVNVPITNGSYSPEKIAGTLGEVVIGKKRRTDPDAITIFDSTGLAIQDLAIAAMVMREGSSIDLPFP
ncbi:MAG: ornithine cyclodeaminase family protein [Methanomicrobiales archaeon]|nr:ornithine cyclodeaminase family protein [Methanomicrobiales archaeon]